MMSQVALTLSCFLERTWTLETYPVLCTHTLTELANRKIRSFFQFSKILKILAMTFCPGGSPKVTVSQEHFVFPVLLRLDSLSVQPSIPWNCLWPEKIFLPNYKWGFIFLPGLLAFFHQLWSPDHTAYVLKFKSWFKNWIRLSLSHHVGLGPLYQTECALQVLIPRCSVCPWLWMKKKQQPCQNCWKFQKIPMCVLWRNMISWEWHNFWKKYSYVNLNFT